MYERRNYFRLDKNKEKVFSPPSFVNVFESKLRVLQ